MTLLTLVENAVRHGIDPSEEGGRIDVRVQRARGPLPRRRSATPASACSAGGDGLGTGLSTLRERLELSSAAMRGCALPQSSRTACAPKSSFRRDGGAWDEPSPDRADRRRRTAAARSAGAPARPGLARARHRRAGAQRARRAVDLFEARQPDICFLDVHMPGMSGVEAARHIGRRAHLVFVTAFDQYAVQAFDAGRARLPRQAGRSRAPGRHRRAPAGAPARRAAGTRTPKRCCSSWPRSCKTPRPPTAALDPAHVGQTLRLIPVDEIDFLRSDEKYTLIAWRRRAGKPGEALIRTPLKDLVAQLDPAQFAQVHRSVVVNLRAISHVTRGQRDRGHPPEGARRRAARQPQLPAPVSPDVVGATRTRGASFMTLSPSFIPRRRHCPHPLVDKLRLYPRPVPAVDTNLSRNDMTYATVAKPVRAVEQGARSVTLAGFSRKALATAATSWFAVAATGDTNLRTLYPVPVCPVGGAGRPRGMEPGDANRPYRG